MNIIFSSSSYEAALVKASLATPESPCVDFISKIISILQEMRLKSFLDDAPPPKRNTGSASVNNELLAVKLSHLPL